MMALFTAAKAGLFRRQYWMNNIVSGVIVGIVALPLAMAFAIASGAKPEQGLYTSIIAGFLVSTFGGSRVQIAGPTGAFIVILAGISAKYGIDGLQIATLMAGIILLLFGITKMGSIIKFIPDPVILGFTAGIAVIIWIGQWQSFFGLPPVDGKHFYNMLWHLIAVLPQFHKATTLLAMLSLVLVIYTPKIPYFKRIPGPLVALVIATTLQYQFQFEDVQTIGTTFGGIPHGLPQFSIPHTQLSQIIELIGPAFTIALLGAIESLLTAVVADGMAGTRHDSNQELIGQGIANMMTPLFGGFAATGAIARTATNIRNGGNSPLSGIIHSLTLLIMLIALAPLANNIPLATLSAILFVVAWNMSEAKHVIKMIHRAPKADVTILLITFILTVFVNLIVAINIGVILAILHFLKRMTHSVEVKQENEEALSTELTHQGITALPPGLLVFSIEGPFFFGMVENFEQALANTHTDPKVLILRFKRVPFVDITGIQTLEEVIANLQNRSIKVLLTEMNTRVYIKLDKAGIIAQVGPDAYFKNFEMAILFALDF